MDLLAAARALGDEEIHGKDEGGEDKALIKPNGMRRKDLSWAMATGKRPELAHISITIDR